MARRKRNPFKTNAYIVRAASAIAVVSGPLCLLISTLLILNYWQVSTLDPLNLPELIQMREQLAASPESAEATIETIRAMDLLARATFFTSQRMLRTGGLIALIAALVFLAALRLALHYTARPPEPAAVGPAPRYWLERGRARELVVFMGGLWLLAALVAAVFTRLDIPIPATEEAAVAVQETGTAPAALVTPDWDTVQRQWPNFRGPGGLGKAYYTTAPVQWDVATGESILWKTEVPVQGFNSPVVWEDRVYLSGADKETREVFCFNAATGELLWRTQVGPPAGVPVELPKVNEDTGYAAPSVAAQGDVVCALFGTGHLACLNKDGVLRWEKFLGVPDNHYGHGSSLIIFERLLLVQYDQRKNGALYAFDLDTGAEAWKQERKHISWASPVLAGTPDSMMLALVSTKNLDVYDPRAGTPLWSVECLSGEVGPSPGYGAGMFFTANDYADGSAIRPPKEASGEPEIVWQFYDSLPDISSPLATDTFFYLLTSRGEIICLRPENGEVAWVHEHENAFFASAILVGDRIYAVDKEGTVLIIKNSDTYEELAALSLGEGAVATPAFLDKRIYARTMNTLVCIGET
ncbi:MAG TPA: PQQ-binding-like beta-propeller repeat protein [Candidatus Hydrogenedentes bacterium]|nr:MAG: outer membrane biogenesis protein BamB [Candidatus Hydrogenedentes bacterium ADurb.Bin179]HOH28878.1 PQQ-binding-like beta-propeller repeat protein [Candidatus Hydrogenedentota bacterium]